MVFPYVITLYDKNDIRVELHRANVTAASGQTRWYLNLVKKNEMSTPVGHFEQEYEPTLDEVRGVLREVANAHPAPFTRQLAAEILSLERGE